MCSHSNSIVDCLPNICTWFKWTLRIKGENKCLPRIYNEIYEHLCGILNLFDYLIRKIEKYEWFSLFLSFAYSYTLLRTNMHNLQPIWTRFEAGKKKL